MTQFELAGGGIPGFEHTQRSSVLIGKNNQDDWIIHDAGDCTIALVSDGCGSKSHSEVGSFLISRLLVAALERAWLSEEEGERLFETRLREALTAARQSALATLETLSRSMLPTRGSSGGRASYSEFVSEYLLCTVVGTLITERHAAFFSIGDGAIVINGELTTLGPFEGNEPPYLAYSLLHTRWNQEDLDFKINRVMNVDELDSFLIGTDGVLDLRDAAERTLPGSAERVGSLDQFWSEDRYFSRSGIRKRLARIQSRQPNHSNPGSDIEEGRLRDDTTFIVGRRRKEDAHV